MVAPPPPHRTTLAHLEVTRVLHVQVDEHGVAQQVLEVVVGALREQLADALLVVQRADGLLRDVEGRGEG